MPARHKHRLDEAEPVKEMMVSEGEGEGTGLGGGELRRVTMGGSGFENGLAPPSNLVQSGFGSMPSCFIFAQSRTVRQALPTIDGRGWSTTKEQLGNSEGLRNGGHCF